MANHPETPSPSQHPEHPDDTNQHQQHTPADSNQGDAAELHDKPPSPSDSFIDLGMPGGPADPFASSATGAAPEPSDQSIVDWAAHVEAAAAAETGASSPKFDRPSDQDWLTHAVDQPPTEADVPGKPATQPAIDIAHLFADPAEVMADLPPTIQETAAPPPAPPIEPAPDIPVLTNESSEEHDSLAADLEVVRQTFNLDELDSKRGMTPPSGASDTMPQPVNLTPSSEEDVFEEIDLSGKGDSSGSFSSSGVDLHQLDSGSFEEIVEDLAGASSTGSSSGIDLGSAELPRLAKPPSSSPEEEDDVEGPLSGRDLIAEAVESGVDLKQPLMEIVQEEEALEATEVVESNVEMKQPLMEISDDEPLEVTEAVESSGTMKQPRLEIVEEEPSAEEEALIASEVVESSSGIMKQPLLEIVEEQEAEEAKAAEGPPSSVVDLGGPADTHQLSQEEIDALLANQEMGSAAEAGSKPQQEQDFPLEEESEALTVLEGQGNPDVPKTHPAGRGPIRETQLQGSEQEEELEEVAAETTDSPREELIEEVASADSGEDLGEPNVQDAAASESGVLLDAAAEEIAAGPEYGDDVQEIILSPDMQTVDSSVLLKNLKTRKEGEVDPEEVQLGEPGHVDETEEAAVKEEKPPKSRPPIMALAGGAGVGTLVGAVGCAAVLYLAGMLGGKSADSKPSQPSPPQQTTQTQAPTAATFDSTLAALRHGDLDRVEKDGIDKIDEAKPDQMAARGEFRWLKYLKQQGTANAPIKKDDELAKQAVDDLTKVSQNAENKTAAAEAMLHLAQINEFANDVPAARKMYENGATQFKDDPKLKRIFDAALNRLNSQAPKPGGMGWRFDPQRPLEEQAFALAMLICLQAPGGDNADDEAGFAFWEAAKKAHDQDFAAAIQALDTARAQHDKRRRTQLRKQQNPLSDPNEDIFLRACDELKVYWTIQDKLRSGGYLTAKGPAAAIDDALKNLAESNDKFKKLDADNKKLVADKKTADTTIDDLTTKLAADKKTADSTIAGLKDMVTKLQNDKVKAENALTAVKGDLAKRDGELKAEKEMVAKVKQQLVDAQAIAKEKDPQGMLGKLQTELKNVKATLKERLEPQDMLAVWLPVLEDRSQKDLTAKALSDAERVLKDEKSTPAQKAQAQTLIGLALRNEDKFPESKAILEDAKKGFAPGSPWLAHVDPALKEVSDPTATYLARVETLRDKGDYDAAVAALTKTIDTLGPDKSGDLLAERSLLRLEALRAKNREPLDANDPAIKAALDDANQAKKTGAARGFYAEGRIDEDLRKYPEALQAYRQAVKMSGDLDATNSRYRVALARLLRQTQGMASPPKEQPKSGATSRLPILNGAKDPRQIMAILLALTLQPPLLPSASVQEANELADQIINAKPGTIPFDIVAQAYVVKGLYTPALKIYAEGLKAQKALKPEYADGLLLLIESHPRLKQTESAKEANPLSAEKHYGAGLRWYFDGNYANAEKEFQQAIQNDGLDARYHYYLGLSRLAQDKPEGNEDFVQGARLELQDRPSRAAVSTALERVQGPMRRALNAVRDQGR